MRGLFFGLGVLLSVHIIFVRTDLFSIDLVKLSKNVIVRFVSLKKGTIDVRETPRPSLVTRAVGLYVSFSVYLTASQRCSLPWTKLLWFISCI